MTQQQNCKKSAKKNVIIHLRKMISKMPKVCEVLIVLRMKKHITIACKLSSKKMQINAGIVKMVCEQKNGCKTGISKKDCQSYKFQYINKKDLPDNFIKSENKSKHNHNKKCSQKQ